LDEETKHKFYKAEDNIVTKTRQPTRGTNKPGNWRVIDASAAETFKEKKENH